MSQETLTWLNRNVLIGQTDKRGHAWHWRASEQGDEPNHYPGFIPVADVQRRLFGFEPLSVPVAFLRPVGPVEPPGIVVTYRGQRYRLIVSEEHQGVVPSDEDVLLGVHGADYRIHSYSEWLLKNVGTILDADLGISSAGLLRRRAQAWVEVSIPENIETGEGVTFRPNLLVFSSLDGSFATTYKRTIGLVVCDNTLRLRMGEAGEEFRVRHTANSLGRITEARQALNIIYKAADEFSAQIHELCAETVTEHQWQQVLSALVPFPEEEGRKRTNAEIKREKLDGLYHFDERCAPWRGTAFGVVQTFNTFEQHECRIRQTQGSGGRPERNLAGVISGRFEALDAQVLDTLRLVTA